MEQSPSWVTNRSSAKSRSYPHFMECKGLLSHSQALASCPYPEPNQYGNRWCLLMSLSTYIIVITCLDMLVFFPNSEHPLSLYVFSKDKSIQNLLVSQLRCGSICVNDTLMQFGGESNKKSNEFWSWWWFLAHFCLVLAGDGICWPRFCLLLFSQSSVTA